MIDQELIAYLDAHFRETSRQIAESREETTQQITSLREENTQQIASLREEVASLREESTQRFEQVEETTRQTLVLVEDLRDQVHVIAEGFLGLNERLDYQSTATLTFEQVRGWIEPYFRDLDRRVRILEGRSDRQQGDVMDAVRKILGKPPLHQAPVSAE
ncbi:MAG TPA: hypothetical protein VGG03_12515 [Thermoanaerobaculia bacterium]|jgi:chromosome segregation ATPase